MVRILYSLGIRLYAFGIYIASFFNKKAAQWIAGRRDWASKLHNAVNSLGKDAKVLWIHCASLGEFEQGRPLIETIKEKQAEVYIVLSFFSPSGYEIRKNYELADLVVYLPADTPQNARRFISILNPSLAVFVKYEFWYNYLSYLKKREIPYFLIAGLFRKQQPFFQWYGSWFQSVLSGFTHLFIQDQSSTKLLDQIDYQHYSVVGDPRVDRVISLSKGVKSFPEIEAFVNGSKVLIIGSSWPGDEAILIPFIKNNLPADWKVILAPHDIKATHIAKIEAALGSNFLKYSEIKLKTSNLNQQVLIIDNIGMLSSLYQYGQVAFIGGGFGSGIHNTLEPIAFGLPVLFGPRYHKFEEANYLVSQQGGFCVENEEDLRNAFAKLLDEEQYYKSSTAANSYLKKGEGATEAIYGKLRAWIE